MSGLLPKLALVGGLLLLATSGVAAELSILLRPSSPTFKEGQFPRFLVTVRNGATSSVRVVDVVRRADLKDAYVRFSVTQSGAPVKVPVAIADPGPISEADLLILAPNQDLNFEHTGFPLGLDRLGPGSYEAQLVFYPDVGATAVRSNIVSFRVVQ